LYDRADFPSANPHHPSFQAHAVLARVLLVRPRTFCQESHLDVRVRHGRAEAVETAIKLARKWGYEKKKIPNGKAKVLSVEGNFHGRTIGIISMSTDPESRDGFGPYLEGVGPVWENQMIRYNHPEDLERVLEKYGDEVAGFLVEPIQGEAG
jgi:acetylornithine/succinyldiaminopimelate/putrescine aminotransferase